MQPSRSGNETLNRYLQQQARQQRLSEFQPMAALPRSHRLRPVTDSPYRRQPVESTRHQHRNAPDRVFDLIEITRDG